MQKCLARLRIKRLERTVFRSAFPSPVGSGSGLGKKYTKSGDVILVIQQPRGSLLPGWVGLPPLLAKYEARKRGEKRLMQVIQEAQGRGGSMRSHSVLRERKQGRILSSKAQIVPKLPVK